MRKLLMSILLCMSVFFVFGCSNNSATVEDIEDDTYEADVEETDTDDEIDEEDETEEETDENETEEAEDEEETENASAQQVESQEKK